MQCFIARLCVMCKKKMRRGKRFVKSMEVKANAEGLLKWLQFFLTTAQNDENVKRLNLEKAG